MNKDGLFEDLCRELGLGILEKRAIRLSGGFMHKMYRLQTDKGDFAIKLLNPVIMERADAFDNYRRADALEGKLQAASIPIVASLEFNHKKMQCVHGQYVYVFNRIDGKALKSEEIQNEHCRIIGSVLADIHKIEIKREFCHRDDKKIDWDLYIQLAEKSCPEIAPLLSDNRTLLYNSQQQGNDAYKKLPALTCICHGDMDNKNVLWKGNQPYIIDLECLNYSNPYMELFELALCWSGYEHCCINYERLNAFITAYASKFGEFEIDWAALYESNNDRLLWLEYNIKRALLIECENEEEQKLGITQVQETINHIIYYDAIKEPLLKNLS